jgi:hypothetical protein
MKSAYELAMERLEKESPRSGRKLTDEQKKRLADIDTEYQAKIAERRIMCEKRLNELQLEGKYEEIQKAQDELAADMRKLEEQKEAKKNQIRQEES